MATLTKNYIVTIDGFNYVLTPELFKTFCGFVGQFYADGADELYFRLTFDTSTVIEIERLGDTYTITGSLSPNSEILTLAEFNIFVSICRTSKNCGC